MLVQKKKKKKHTHKKNDYMETFLTLGQYVLPCIS